MDVLGHLFDYVSPLVLAGGVVASFIAALAMTAFRLRLGQAEVQKSAHKIGVSSWQLASYLESQAGNGYLLARSYSLGTSLDTSDKRLSVMIDGLDELAGATFDLRQVSPELADKLRRARITRLRALLDDPNAQEELRAGWRAELERLEAEETTGRVAAAAETAGSDSATASPDSPTGESQGEADNAPIPARPAPSDTPTTATATPAPRVRVTVRDPNWWRLWSGEVGLKSPSASALTYPAFREGMLALSADIATVVREELREELHEMQRRSFWPNFAQNFCLSLFFFVAGIVATAMASKPH